MLGFRRITNAATRRIGSLNKVIPLACRPVGEGLDKRLTRRSRMAADQFLRCGPGDVIEEELTPGPHDPFMSGCDFG